MRLIIEPTYDAVSRWAANYVVSCINKFKPTEDKPFVLGLPTGSSPLGMYKHLIELNRKGVVSFRNVVTFNIAICPKTTNKVTIRSCGAISSPTSIFARKT